MSFKILKITIISARELPLYKKDGNTIVFRHGTAMVKYFFIQGIPEWYYNNSIMIYSIINAVIII